MYAGLLCTLYCVFPNRIQIRSFLHNTKCHCKLTISGIASFRVEIIRDPQRSMIASTNPRNSARVRVTQKRWSGPNRFLALKCSNSGYQLPTASPSWLPNAVTGIKNVAPGGIYSWTILDQPTKINWRRLVRSRVFRNILSYKSTSASGGQRPFGESISNLFQHRRGLIYLISDFNPSNFSGQIRACFELSRKSVPWLLLSLNSVRQQPLQHGSIMIPN